MLDDRRYEPGQPYGLIPYRPYTPPARQDRNELAIVSLIWGLFNAAGMVAVMLRIAEAGRYPEPTPGVFLAVILLNGGIVASVIALIIGCKGLFQGSNGRLLAALGILCNLTVLLGTGFLWLVLNALQHL